MSLIYGIVATKTKYTVIIKSSQYYWLVAQIVSNIKVNKLNQDPLKSIGTIKWVSYIYVLFLMTSSLLAGTEANPQP